VSASGVNPSTGAKPPAADAIREQLERILVSSDFASADRARRLLRFLVEETLAGRTGRLKEYTLAVEVFDRDATFDSSTNPAVRVEASRLRRRLEHYYLTQGREDPLLIELPRGTYVPVFLPQCDVLHLRDQLTQVEEHGETGEASASPPIRLPNGPSIAVMPFENLGDAADRLLCDGITVEILTALARFREFQILGRHTIFRHRGNRDPVAIHRELGARYILEGSVQRSGERLRVNVELASGANGTILWTERYECDATAGPIFDVQDEIASHAVATLAQPHGVIARPELVLAKRKHPENLDAYDCLLLFYDYTAHHAPEAHRRIRDALERHVKTEPDVSMLWAALSMIYTDSWRFGFNPEKNRQDSRDKGLQAARKAIDCDPLNPLAYHAAFLAYFARNDLKAFREAAERAVNLNPNNTDILADYGLHLTLCDDAPRGILLLKVALALNPEPPDWYWFPFFIWHYDRGEFEAALDMALRAESQDFYWTYGMHAIAYAAVGMDDEARAAAKRLLELYPTFGERAREELSHWMDGRRMQPVLDLLQRSGVSIPPG
jgi:TolB-like protein